MNNVSIVIVNWNGKKFLTACFDSLRNQAYQPNSIILVDNGSIDDSVEHVKRHYPEVKIIALSNNLGFCKANNIAIKSIDSKYIALLNNDTVAHPMWLKNLVQALESNPKAGFAASKMLLYKNPNIIDRAGDAYTRAGTGFLRGRGLPALNNYDRLEWVFGACAGAAMYRSDIFNDIGVFDEDFFLLYEDVDLSFRAQLKGYKCLYVPDAIVYHKVSSSIGWDSPISIYYSHRNLEWVYIHNMPGGLIPRTITNHMLYNFCSFFYFLLIGKANVFLKAKLDALKGFKTAISKRKAIQRVKCAEDEYLLNLFRKESLFLRLANRLSKSID